MTNGIRLNGMVVANIIYIPKKETESIQGHIIIL